MGLIRRILMFTLLVALSSIGIPLPAHAASGEETPVLTFQGRATGVPFSLPALAHQYGGGGVGRIGKLGVDPLANGALLGSGIGGGLGLAISAAYAEITTPARLVIPAGATDPALLTQAPPRTRGRQQSRRAFWITVAVVVSVPAFFYVTYALYT